MNNARKKLIIIIATLLLHSLSMLVIFVIYQEPSRDFFADFNAAKAVDVPETVFYDPSQNQTAPAVDDQELGQFKPRASTLGASMEMPNGPIGIEQEGEVGEKNDGEPESQTQEPVPKSAQIDAAPFEYSGELIPTFAEGENQKIKKNSPFHPEEHVSASRRKARQALAGITRGYLQQLQDEGENLIKTIGGNPNKKPTAEQLKHERYFAKVQWCLQNAHAINQEKCQMHDAIEAVMKIYFVLNREGKITQFQIVQSSGFAYVDQYISSLFTYASSSFPPLPAYIKEDHFPISYTVLINWNTGFAAGFSRS